MTRSFARILGFVLASYLLLWILTALCGPWLVLHYCNANASTKVRIQLAYHSDELIARDVREGLLKIYPAETATNPNMRAHLLNCPTPLVVDLRIGLERQHKGYIMTSGRYLILPWHIYMLNEDDPYREPPNHAPEPTALAVTPAASASVKATADSNAPVAPAGGHGSS